MCTRFGFGFVSICIVLFAAIGCDSPAPPPTKTDTGAESAARLFFESLRSGAWDDAYDLLISKNKRTWNKDSFISRAKNMLKKLGFEPMEVGVSVTESADSATAVAVYKNESGGIVRHWRDGATLHRIDGKWYVGLRENFGTH